MLFLKGYIHFPIIKCPDTGIKLLVTLYENDRDIEQKEFTFSTEQVREKEFEINFDNVVRIDPAMKYDITSQVKCEYFQGRYGQNAKTSGLLTFSKSSKDNNSTSPTTGQFKAFQFYKKI